MKLYLIGSLRNEAMHDIGNQFRELLPDWEIFNDWLSPGPNADDYWKAYEEAKGNTYLEALKGHAATHVFEFDRHHIDTSDAVALISPAGKSGHLELGYALGSGKRGYYLLDKPDRWDVMLQFCTGVYLTIEEISNAIKTDFNASGLLVS